MGGIQVHFDGKEVYPKANSFGVWAWTCTDYHKALEKFDEVTQNVIDRINNKQ